MQNESINYFEKAIQQNKITISDNVAIAKYKIGSELNFLDINFPIHEDSIIFKRSEKQWYIEFSADHFTSRYSVSLEKTVNILKVYLSKATEAVELSQDAETLKKKLEELEYLFKQ